MNADQRRADAGSTVRPAPSASGVLVVDKPVGPTSHDVVARVRRLMGTRRVGHAGTLDPMASGVLVLGVEKATRLLGHLALTEKAYEATIRLGVRTLTDDAQGEVLDVVRAAHLGDEQVCAALRAFTGQIQQVPSAVSAIKVGGRRGYERVRAGEVVELAARPVTVHDLSVTALRRDGDVVDVDIAIVCSSGTYVRAIARDLGEALAVGGHLTMLRRTRVGHYDLTAARPLEQLQEAPDLVPIESAAAAAFPTWEVAAADAAAVSHGAQLRWPEFLPERGPVAVFDPAGRLLALAEPRAGRAKLLAVFV